MENHHHGAGGCEHSHSHDGDPAVAYSLYQKIDTVHVQCFNESEEGSGKKVFKPWEERLDKTEFVESDVDEELLMFIPFTGSVKLKSVIVIGGEDGKHPKEMRLFKNRPPQGFDGLGGEPEQVIQLSQDPLGQVEYSVKVSRFNSVSSLTIHFASNYGDETSRVYYIGLKGDFTKGHRHEVTITNYEAAPNPADHKTEQVQPVSNFVS